jgi:hypothetical protein
LLLIPVLEDANRQQQQQQQPIIHHTITIFKPANTSLKQQQSSQVGRSSPASSSMVPFPNHSPMSQGGSFFGSYGADEDPKSHQMCGKGFVDKLLRKTGSSSSSRQQVGPIGGDSGTRTKCFLNPSMKLGGERRIYAEVPESMNLTGTDSSSCASEKSHEEWHMEELLEQELDIVQFDPTELELQEDGSVEVHTPNSQRQVSKSFSLNTQQPQTSSWSLTLPSVAEEASDEDEEEEEEEDDDDEGLRETMRTDENNDHKGMREQARDENAGFDPQKKKILAAMRTLVLKQQVALKELSQQNYQYRRELADQQIAVLRLKEENEKQHNRIKQLEAENQVVEAANVWMREEIHVAKGEISLPPTKSKNAFIQRSRSAPVARNNASEVANFQPFKRNTSSESKSRNWDPIIYYDGSDLSSSHDSIPESRSDIIFAIPHPDVESTEQRDQPLGHADTISTSQGVGSKPTKEEVALFRSRLEAIQHRRVQRRSERDQRASGPVVSFG